MRPHHLAVAVFVAFVAAGAPGDEIARANLNILGISLEVDRATVASGIDIPVGVQTFYGGKKNAEATPPPDLSVLGDLTGPALDHPLTLATRPGGQFQIPALHLAGEYVLQNIRLVDRDGRFIQSAIPSFATITISDVLKTNVRVRQLSTDELRARGLNLDARNFDVFEITMVFGIQQNSVEIPYSIIVDKRTHEIISAPTPSDVHLPKPPVAGPPPRFQPPDVFTGVVTEDIDAGGAPAGGAPSGDSEINRRRPVIPMALVVPAGFGVLHQFFAVILNVSNNGTGAIRLENVSASLTSPLAMRVAKVNPPVSVGQAVPITDKITGTTFLIAQAEGSAEWTLEALRAGTHTLSVAIRATYTNPGQPAIPLKGNVSAAIVVSDPRFQVNFIHPDTVRKGEPYEALALITNASPTQQTVVVDTHEISPCSTGIYANNICRIDGDPSPELTIAPGETKTVRYHLQSGLTGHIYAAAANAESGVSASVTLAMGVSASGVPLSPATLILPYYSRFLDPDLVNAHLALFGIGYSLATAPLTARTALLPRVLRNDVFQRAQDVARAGQRIFISRRDASHDDAAEDRDPIFHLALDLLGNIERVNTLATAADLREWDELRRLDDNGRKAGAAMAREFERVGLAGGKSITQLVDSFATATSHRSPFAFAAVHGAAGPGRPFALTVTGASSRMQMSIPAEGMGGWVRSLAYGELAQLNSPAEYGECAIVGRWSESLELSIVANAPTFTVDLIYPDTADGSFLRASLPITNADPHAPVKIVIERGKAPAVAGAQVAGSLTAMPVPQAALQLVAAAQDLHLDDDGHVVSILTNRPMTSADRDQFALTTRVAATGYEVTRRNDPPGEVVIPGAALQDDGRVINVSFDHALSSNATYSIAVDALGTLVPRIDNTRPGGILAGKLLRGDGSPVPNTAVQLTTGERNQFDITLPSGDFLFEYVPRDIDRNISGNYTLTTQAEGKFAQLDGAIRTPGQVQRVVLQFLGRGSVTGTLKYSDGSIATGVITAGSTVYSEFHQSGTDALGVFTIRDLPVGPITLAATDAKGNVTYAATQIHVPGEVVTRDLVFQKRDLAGFATIRVTVKRSDTGTPVAGAHVGVYTQGYGLLDGHTDDNGRFEFTKVPAGFVSLLASEFTLTRESAGIDFDLRSDSVVEQVLTLHVPVPGDPQFVTLHGSVWRDDPAAPNDRTRDRIVPNAVITIRGLAPVSADVNGEYSYPSVPLALSDKKVVLVFDPETGRQAAFGLPTLQAGVTNELRLLLQTAAPRGTATIRVRLLNAAGATVSDYRVISPGFPADLFVAKGNGVYELTVNVPQVVSVWAVPNGRHPVYGDQFASGGARADFDGQISVLELRLPGQGTVLAKILIRKPCPNGQTSCAEEYDVAQGKVGIGYPIWDDAEQQLSISQRSITTDPMTGVATITQVPVGQNPGIETIDHPAGYASATVATAFDGDTRQVELKLSQLGSASGRVLSFDGQTPIAGASVRLAGSSAILGPVITGPDGAFRFTGVAANQSFRITAEISRDGLFRTGFVDASSPRFGGPVSGLTVMLRQQGSVDGTIVDGSGVPLPLARYWARELSWPNRTFGSATDPLIAGSDGHFFLSNVFSGGVRVSAVSPVHQEDRGDWQGEIKFEKDNQTNVRLQVGGGGSGSVSVTVVDPNNAFQRVSLAEVTLVRNGMGFDFGITDQNGVAVFDNVPAGNFDYSVRAASKRVGRSGSGETFRLARDAIVPVQIVLDLLGRVAGTLVDGDLTPSPPVKGAPVLLLSGALNTTTSTGGAGDFLFDGVPEGAFRLDAIDPDSGRHAFSTGDLFISKLFPDRSGIQLSLEKTARIHVKVYLPDDAGNAGVLAPLVDVKVSQGGTPYVRELQGNDLIFAKMFSRFGYHIEAKEMGGEERTVRYDGAFASGTSDGEVALVFATSGTVQVHVTADDPSLIANARVTINSSGKSATIFTDGAGNATAFGLALGPINVQVTSANLSAALNGTLLSHAAPLVVTVKLGNRAVVDGYVDAEEGGPSAGTRVFIEVSSALLSGLLRLDTRTDADGHYAFAGIPIGSTRVTLTMLGPDDSTTGAVIREQPLPDGATGVNSMPRMRLDATPPRVLNIDPANNANSVAPNAGVIVTFSEPLNPSFILSSFIQLVATDNNTQVAAAMTTDFTNGQFRVRLAPSVLLRSNVVYRVSVSGSIQDLAGHPLIAPAGSTFTTVNYAEPRVIHIDPSVELPVAEGTSFRLKFNKAIDGASFQNGAVARLEQLDALHGQPIAAIPIQVFVDPSDAVTLVISPAGIAIQPASFYRVTVSGMRDTQSPPNIQIAPQFFDFFSFDHLKPSVAIVSPVPAGFALISNVAYTAGVKVTEDGATPSKDIQYVDWFDSGGVTDHFLIRTKIAPYGYNFAAPQATTYTLKASATDFSGNTSELATFTWNVAPNNPPASVAVTTTPGSAYLAGHVDVAVTFADEGLTATIALKAVGSHADGSAYALPVLNQQATRVAVDAAWPAVHFGLNLPRDLKEGDPLHVTATVTDSVNQSSSANADIVVLTDAIAPRVLSLAPVTETHFKFGTNYRITLTAKDLESGIARVTFAYDGKLVEVTSGTSETFATDAVVTAKNADTRIHIVATAYDFHGNSAALATDVIYDSVNDGTVPLAQWLTPLDGAALPAGQSTQVKLRVHATDDVHVEAVQFESDAFAAPVPPVSVADANGVYEAVATIQTPASGSFNITATVSDANPAHNVILPIAIDAVAVDESIVADAGITPSNAAQYSNRTLLVSGAGTRLYITVPLTLRNLIVLNGAKISNPDRTPLDLTVNDRLFVDGDSSIDLTSKGYLGGWARSEDGVTQNNDARGMSNGVGALDASGSHGGLGTGASPNPAYDSVAQPADFGAGGAGAPACCGAGANGGGAIALRGGIDPAGPGRIVIAGSVRADGGSGIGARYAGAGGSVALTARALVTGPMTRITANGGDDDAVTSGDAGAGGGRIALSVAERLDLFDPATELQARGGRNGSSAEGRSYLDGGAGTIFLRRPGATAGELIVSALDERYPASAHLTRSTPIDGTLVFDAITVGPRALARFDAGYTAAQFKVDPTAVVLTASDRPAITLTPAPPAGATLIQDTSFTTSYAASSIAGVGSIVLSFISTATSAFTDYPLTVPATQVNIAVPPDAPAGPSVLRAIVTDRAGRTSEATSAFTIAANAPPSIDRLDVSPLQIYAGHTIVANVTASDDISVRAIGLTASSGTVSSSPPVVNGKSMSQAFSIALTPASPSGTIVQLTATASDGFPSRPPTTQNASVTVLADPNPPSVTITSPAPNASFDVSSLVRIPIRATAIDAEVGVTQVWASIDGGPPIAMSPDASTINGWMADVPVPSVDGLDPVTKSIVVFAKDYQGNTGESAARPIRIQPVIDPNGPSVTWLCPSPGALFSPGYAAKVRISAVPASQDNGVVSVNFFVGDSMVAVAASSVGNNIWEATLTMPPGVEGTTAPLKVVATSIRNNVATLQRTIALAAGNVITSDTTIGAANTTFENTTVIVTGGTLTIDGHHTFARLLVLDGAVVTHSISGTLDVQVNGLTYISCGGSIDASGRGSQDAVGAGAVGSGGSHGGEGGGASLGPFGSTFDPRERGGAGVNAANCAPCEGTGGGILRLRPQSLIVDGRVAADGKGTQAGGAGGSIRIDAGAIAGSGTISANGAVAATRGGGGRIALYFTSLALPRINLSATGASAGTVYLKSSSQAFGDLIVDNKGQPPVGKSALIAVGIRTTTAATANTITDASAQLAAPNALTGIHLIFGNDVAASWPIVANDSTTLTITPDGAFTPQTGAPFRGLYRFDTLTIRNANLETMDLMQVGSSIDKDSASTLILGNLGPPIVNGTLISIAPSALGFAIVGRGGAVVDPDKPVVITARNARTNAIFTTVATNDGAFSVPISGNINDAFTLTAKDSHRFPLESAAINAGTLAGGTPPANQISSSGWNVDAAFAARTLSLDGHTLAVASYPVGATGTSDRLVVLDIANPNAPVLRRTVNTAIGAIRDAVVQDGWAYIVGDRFATLNLDVANAPMNTTTDPCGRENAVAVSGGYAFTADADCASNGTLYVYDVSNRAAPRFLGGQSIAGLTSHNFTDLQLLGTDYLIGISPSASGRDIVVLDRRDANAIKKVSELQIPAFDAFRAVVSGNKLYVVSQTASQMLVVDLQNPAAPAISGTLALSTPAGGAAVIEKDILIADGTNGLVASSSDPTLLAITGSVATGGTAFDVAVFGGTAYVANGTGISIVTVGVAPIIDRSRIAVGASGIVTGAADSVRGQMPVTLEIRNAATAASTPASIAQDGSFSASVAVRAGDPITITATDGAGRIAGPVGVGSVPFGTASKTTPVVVAGDANFRARTIAVDGSNIVVAGYPDATGSVGSSDKIAIYDVTNPSAPVLRRITQGTQGSIRDVVIQGNFAYSVGDRFGTLNIVDANATPNFASDPCGRENAVAVSGGYAFTADTECANNGTIYVYDVTNPAAPRFLSGQAVAGTSGHVFTDLQLLGSDYLVGISNSTSGRDIIVIDRRDVNALRKVSELQIAGVDAFRGRVVGTMLYVSGGDGGFTIVDLSNPTLPRILSTVNTPGIARGIDVAGTTIAMSDGSGVSFYEASDPANPRLVGVQPTGGVAWDAAFGGRSLYVANDQGLVVVENVAAPPRIDRNRITVSASSPTTGAINGVAGAIAGELPIQLSVRDTSTSAAISITLPTASDGSFSVVLPAAAGEGMTVTATDGVGRVAGPVGVGSVPFGTAAKTTPVVVAGDANFRARTIAVDGSNVAVAGYPDATGSVGSSDKIAIYDVTNPSAPVLRRITQGTQGSIRDVVIQGDWAYVVGDRLATLNIANANATPNFATDPCGRENAVAVSGGYAFTADTECANNGTIYVYDVTNPAAPRFLSGQAVAGMSGHVFTDLQLLGSDYLVGISNSTSGRDIIVIDRRDVNALRKVSELQIAGVDGFRGRVVGTMLYVSGGDGGFAIVDLSNPTLPQILSTVNTPGIARGIDIAGTTVAISDGSGVSFYEVSDPANPRLAGVQPTGGVAWDGAFGGRSLYVANDQGLAVIENVAAPPRIDLSKITLTFDGVSSVSIAGAAGAVTGMSPLSLQLRDASTSASITIPASSSDGSFTATLTSSPGDGVTATAIDGAGRTAGPLLLGNVPFGTGAKTTGIVISNDNFRARTVAAEGATVVIAGYPDAAGTAGSSDKIAVYDVTNPAAPILRRTLNVSAISGSIRDIAVQSGWAYIVADRFATLNLADPNATPTAPDASCGRENAIAISGGYAFTSDSDCANNGTVFVYDVSNPAAPVHLSTQAVGGISGHVFTDLIAFGTDYLVGISNSSTGRDLMVIDRRDPNSLRKVAELRIANLEAFRGKIVGNLIYLAGGDSGAAIVDLSDPVSPRVVWTGNTNGIARGVDVAGKTMAIADGDGIAFYDATDPANPRYLGTQSVGGVAWDVAFTGSSLIAANDLGMAIIDRIYTAPNIAPSLISINSDGIASATVTGSAFAVSPAATTVTVRNVTTTPTSNGSFSATVTAKAGEQISITATDSANRSATRAVGAVPFVTVVRNDPALIGGDSAFRARRIATDGTNWLATNGTVAGLHINGGSSRALLFRQPNASAPPQITNVDASVGTVEDIAMRNGFGFAAGDRFSTINMLATPQTVQVASDACGRELAVAIAGNNAFTAETDCSNAGGINIYDVANPAAPILLRSQAVAGLTGISYRALIPFGTQYLLAISPDKPGGLGRDVTLIDRSNLNSLIKVAELDVPAFDAVAGALDGSTLYLAGGEAGIAIVDLANPASPVWRATIDTPGIARSVAVTSPTEIVVADSGGPGLTFIDTSDRMHPIVLGSQPLQGNPTDVKVIGNRIYVATETRAYVVSRP